MEEIFDSAIRSKGDLAGVFEFDGETSYFYLFNEDNPQDNKIIDAIRITSSIPTFCESDVSIKWDAEERRVGLFINGVLWAMFDCQVLAKFGGDFKVDKKSSLSDEVYNWLD